MDAHRPPRLVAVDMDGTFLHHDDTYDRARFARLRTQMDAAGVRFVVASGNQYEQISSFFPYRDELSFVGDNGAYVVEQGTPLFAAQIVGREDLPRAQRPRARTDRDRQPPCRDARGGRRARCRDVPGNVQRRGQACG